MLQQAGNKRIGNGRQLALPTFVKEHVFPVLEQGHVQVHPGAGNAVDRLGHKGGVEAVLLGQGLHRQLQGHDLVGSVHGVHILEVDLMLAHGALVVAGLDLKAHLLQVHAHLPAGGLPVVQGAQVEVARLVPGLGGGVALFVGLKEEKFQLRPDVEGVKAHVVGPLQHPAEHPPGITHKGGAVGIVHVADQPGHLALGGPPGENGKAVQVGIEALVRLVDPGEALDGGTVKHDLVVDSLLHLGGGDGHILQLAEDIHKLHADKFDLLLLHHPDDIFLGITHGGSLLPSVLIPCAPMSARVVFHIPRV